MSENIINNSYWTVYIDGEKVKLKDISLEAFYDSDKKANRFILKIDRETKLSRRGEDDK